MSDIPPSNAGIPCDDSQDCPKDMWCRDVDGRKRCQRTINPDIGLYIGLGFAGLVGFFILAWVIFLIFDHLSERNEPSNKKKIIGTG